MRNIAKLILASVLAFCAAACAPVDFLNSVIVPHDGYHVVRGLAYGEDPRQKLDVYVPDDLKAPAPVLVFIYGGSWQDGSRGIYRFLGQAFASEGIVTVVADYRLYPQVKYPAFVNDTAAAFKYAHDHIAQYGGDPSRMFISGHSAGAYNAMMVAVDPSYLKAAGADPSWIKGVIGIAGPYDFLPLTDPKLIDAFGGANVAATQPINYVDGKRAPMLLVCGTDDETVSPGNTERMAAKLRAFGTDVEVKEYTGTGHIGIILSLAPLFRGKTSLREDMVHFIRTHG